VPTVDRFANDKNKKADTFFSAVYCPGAAGVDAFNYTWCLDGVSWIFSPLETVGESFMQVKILSGCWNLLVATVENQLFLSFIPTRKIQAMFSRIMGVLWCKYIQPRL
jgi:hypothetical protein